MRRLILALTLTLSACGPAAPAATISPMPSDSPTPMPLRFVALGDSYTIGTSIGEADRWPNRLVEALGPGRLELVENLAVNGSTSRNVFERQVPRLGTLRPDFVSLLIGVNDVVQGVPAATFRASAAAVLDAILDVVPAGRVLVVSTPDYTVTPAGADYGNPDQRRAGIIENNEILRALAEERGIAFVDIFDISSEAAADRSLVARDGLHPSGAQYGRWVERILPVVERLLE